MNAGKINSRNVFIPIDQLELEGELALPANARSLVLFAHGSGSSRLSSRNQMVAGYLNQQGIATLLFDLLTYKEARDAHNRFNIPLLAGRLALATEWVKDQQGCAALHLGYFGASTGAAAALLAAGDMKEIAAIVCRGGRPDLAMEALPFVHAPTLLIVGEKDKEILPLNQQALNGLQGEKRMDVVTGASHLFEEEGAMEKVCVLAAGWFELHLHSLELNK